MKNEKLTNRKLCYASIVVHTVMYCDAFVFCTRVTRAMREKKRVAIFFSFSLQLELDDTHSTLDVLNKQFYAITSITESRALSSLQSFHFMNARVHRIWIGDTKRTCVERLNLRRKIKSFFSAAEFFVHFLFFFFFEKKTSF